LTEHSGGVFLSYASLDAEAARRICEALRAAGIEVWFDQSELRGGDALEIKSVAGSCRRWRDRLVGVSNPNTSGNSGLYREAHDLAISK